MTVFLPNRNNFHRTLGLQGSFFLGVKLLSGMSNISSQKVAVGISGGVDSAVAAALLKEQGYEVIGVHLYCYDEGPYCTAKEDRVSAVRVAKYLGIPLIVWDLRKEYKDKVISYFFGEYKAGRTPNPDVVCNREIKFGIFLEKALKELGVDYIATGHYARIKKDRKGFHLLRGMDEKKDQSYFLYNLTEKQLEQILFPIGDYRKPAVRELAKKFKLPNYSRRDSMGVCFIGPIPISKFLRENLPIKLGAVVNIKGEVVGEHDGVWFFTEGQRHGFKVFSAQGGQGLPLYVIDKDVSSNTLIVGRGEETKVKEFEVEKPNWIKSDYKVAESPGLRARIRHLGELLPARFLDGKKLRVILKESVFGVAPGQSAVFYRNEEVLGGAVISRTVKP